MNMQDHITYNRITQTIEYIKANFWQQFRCIPDFLPSGDSIIRIYWQVYVEQYQENSYDWEGAKINADK